jgi:hypothetical protein
MEEGFVTASEAAAIVLKCGRGHGRIAESRVALDVRRFSLIDIAACGCESIVKTLPSYFLKLRRRRWLIVDRMWMRTSRQRQRQQQGRQGKPFLHIVSFRLRCLADTAGATFVSINT